MNNSQLAYSLFLGLRKYVLPGSLSQRDVFISYPRWRHRPRAVYPKKPLDVCLDTLFGMPAMMRQLDGRIEQKCQAVLAQ